MSEVQRGTIRCRKDPKDPKEWQFALERGIAYKDKQAKHGLEMEANNKVEALSWMEARKAGNFLCPDDGLAESALADVLPANVQGKRKTGKGLEAIQDIEPDENNEAQVDKLAAAVEEADCLSDLGSSKNKELTAKRVLKMLKLVKEVNDDLQKTSSGSKGSSHQKALKDCQTDLQKLAKLGQKVKLENAKDTLCEAALAIKRASKALEKS